MYANVKSNRSTASSRTLLFYETSQTGIFDGELETSGTSVYIVESDLEPYRIICVPTSSSSSYKKTQWVSKSSSMYSTNVDFGCLEIKGQSSTNCVFDVSSSGNNYRLRVFDEHGTNVGSVGGTVGTYYTKGQFVGVRHKTTTSGHSYGGVKVTCKESDLISTGWTKDGNGFLFPSDYDAAIIIWLNDNADIEFLYDQEPPQPVVKTVTLDPAQGIVSPTTIECTVGETYGDLPLPTREGYIFDGWYAQPGDTELVEGNTPFTSTSATLLKAHWTAKPVGTFTISFDLNGGSGGPDAISVVEGESTTIPSDQIPTKDGATFIVWLYNETDKYPPGSTIKPTSDMVLVAQWQERKPRPDSQKDYLVFGSGGVLCFDPASGSMVYAV